MTELAEIFARGFVIVFLVALNVSNIAHKRTLWAFLSGCGVSLAWWSNAHTAALDSSPLGAINYAIGAGFGTISGMKFGNWINGGIR